MSKFGPQTTLEFERENMETYSVIQAIKNSGQLMWYYNQNQIQRMKIKKNEFTEEICYWK